MERMKFNKLKEINPILAAFAFAVSILILSIPLTSATQVNILFNGVVQQSVQASPANLVTRTINVPVRDPTDITWTNVRVHMSVSSASLSHTIEKIYVFKCRLLNPVSCSSTAPIEFESFAEVNLPWRDVSESDPSGLPTANLMTLVKLKDSSGQVSWLGYWDKITRPSFDTFTKFSYDLDQIDFYARSVDLVNPIVSYISSTQMLPFSWATKVAFRTQPLYSIGGNEEELSAGTFTAATLTNDQVTSLNKDYYLVAAQTTSGIASFIPLARNPTFNCGNGIPEPELGETSSLCCFDVGCPTGSFCDISDVQNPGSAQCKSISDVSLTVSEPSIPTVNDCSTPVSFDLRVRVNNPPASLPQSFSAVATINSSFTQAVTCTRSGDLYTCPVEYASPVSCGSGTIRLQRNSLNASVTVNDGSGQRILDLSSSIPDFNLAFNCGCADGFFCDSVRSACMSEGSITVSVYNVTSYLDNFDPSVQNYITVTAQINNAPSDLVVTGTTYTLGTLFKDSVPILNSTTGSITCSGGSPAHFYTCRIQISITGYDSTFAYFFRGNQIKFQVIYSDRGTPVSPRQLAADFSDITIPAFSCGNGACDISAGETESNCCIDCRCSVSGFYCDVNHLSCDDLVGIGMEILSPTDPVRLSGCSPSPSHSIEILARVTSPPSDLSLASAYYIEKGQVVPWPLNCVRNNPAGDPGLFNCTLSIPAIPQCQAQSQDFLIGPNSLNMTVTFSNGRIGPLSKTLQRNFPDIILEPVYTCGNSICEGIQGENAANCCRDCACQDNPAFGPDSFCNIQQPTDPGTCLNKNSVRLKIDSPTAPIRLGTCELSQDVEILAHLENQPANINGISFAAVLNKENADMLTCDASRLSSTPATTNPTSSPIRCTLRVPAERECSQAHGPYVYNDNSISATLSVSTTTGPIIFTTPPANLPGITTTQSVRSLFDITDNAKRQMSDVLHNMQDTAKKLFDWTETCLKGTQILALAGIAMMIAVPLAAHFGGGNAALGAGAGALLGAFTFQHSISTNLLGVLGLSLLGAGAGGVAGSRIDRAIPQDNQLAVDVGYNKNAQGGHAGTDDISTGFILNTINGVTYGSEFNYGSGEVPPDLMSNDPSKFQYVQRDGKWYHTNPSTSGGNWQASLQTSVQVARNLFEIWGQICRLITEQYSTQLQVQQIQAQFISAQVCMEVAQHQIDLGVASGQELSAFNNMASCLNIPNLQGSMNDLRSRMDQTAHTMHDLGESFSGLETLGSYIGGTGTGQISVRQNNGPLPGGAGKACNKQPGPSSVWSSIFGGGSQTCDRNDVLNVNVLPGTGCRYPAVTIFQDGRYLDLLCQGNSCASSNFGIDTVLSRTNLEFRLFCFSSQQQLLSSVGTLASRTSGMSAPVEVLVDTNGDCMCGPGDENQFSGQPSGQNIVALSTPQTTIQSNAVIDLTVTVSPQGTSFAPPFEMIFDSSFDTSASKEYPGYSATVRSRPIDSSRTIKVDVFTINPQTHARQPIGSRTIQITVQPQSNPPNPPAGTVQSACGILVGDKVKSKISSLNIRSAAAGAETGSHAPTDVWGEVKEGASASLDGTNYVWWNVDWPEITGWVAEGTSGNCNYLEKCNSAETSCGN